jgi:hypothetical protein
LFVAASELSPDPAAGEMAHSNAVVNGRRRDLLVEALLRLEAHVESCTIDAARNEVEMLLALCDGAGAPTDWIDVTSDVGGRIQTGLSALLDLLAETSCERPGYQ